ncbi:DivIVA domain-containing protein [Nonomuraea basaltis]|nr:DivIVA domain-containing protein [Nonomuraea basaltis]TMR99123.1 DivIVA domain-containing protein [Nonomuraea basaltis]
MDESVEQGRGEFFDEPPHRYEFDVVLRGYHRRQVRDALLDCIRRLQSPA